LQSQALSGTRARCGPGGYIQVGMRGCVLIDAPHLRHRWWKIESLLLSGLPPSGGRGLSCLLALFIDGSSAGGGAVWCPDRWPVCVALLCLVAACIVVDLATLVARVTQSPWGHTVVVYLGGTRGEGPKPGSSLGTTLRGDFRERDGCGWGEMARLRGFHVTNRLIYRRVQRKTF
jgi:hypothetical protein